MKLKTLAIPAVAATSVLLTGLTFAWAQENALPRGEDRVLQAQFRGEGHREGRGHGVMRGMMGLLQEIDGNDDGAITQTEVDAYRAAIVNGADTSGEGDLSLEEFETIWAQQTRERMVDAFQKLDADGNGLVTQEELDDRFGNIVERMDRNGDGQLDREDRRGRRG